MTSNTSPEQGWRTWLKKLRPTMGLRIKFSLLFYVVTLGAMGVIGYFGYSNASNAYRGKAEDLLRGYTVETAQKILSNLDTARSDAAFHSRSYDLLRHAYWLEMGDAVQAEYWRKVATEYLRNFDAAYKYIYTIRFLDRQGKERIFVRKEPNSDDVKTLADDALQDRTTEDYFTWGIMLPKGDMFVSKLDMNKLGSHVEKPYVPVVRFAIPLIGGNDVTYGVVVTNLYADVLFDYIRQANNNQQGRRFYLIDSDGQYLFHTDAAKAFGRILNHDAEFQRDFPGLLPEVNNQEAGLITSQGRLIAFQHIYPLPSNRGRYWTLVGVVDEEIALAELNQFRYVFSGLLVLVGLIVLGITQRYLGMLITPLSFVTRQLQRLGRGETGLELMEYHSHDEVSLMLECTSRVMTTMERTASLADIISQGDFSTQLELLSQQDRLGRAINNMTTMLREAKTQNEQRTWLTNGLTQLNQALIGDLDATRLADTALSQMGRYVDAGRGVFYTYRPEQSTLELLGSYMYSERDALGNSYRLGEGAVGQVARERKPIVLHTLPKDAAPILTGTTCNPPLHTYTYPLLRDDDLLGVIEFATFERLDALQQEFLMRAAEIAASFLYIAEQRERIQSLLDMAEKATLQAREESSKAQAANALLEEQQQQLQQQTEELQQVNTQMEEQQQQLQQQTEELRQANAQLNEQQQQLQTQTNELERKNAALIVSREELEHKAEQVALASKYKSEFLANMSHELRTPLNSIILLSKMLGMNEAGKLSDEEIKRVNVIHQAGEELLRLINDILDLSKIESGRMELHTEDIGTEEILAECRSLFEATAQEKGLQFVLEARWQGSFISDHAKLSQILRNLLSNAFKFTKQGAVTLRVERDDAAPCPILISVTDSGIGIPEDKQELIFQAFHQVDGTISREFGGTGLGLTISQRFAELLGGAISIQSVAGKGSTFTLHLPLQPGTPSVIEATPPPLGKPQEAAREPVKIPTLVGDDRNNLMSGDTVILLIDDDPAYAGVVVDLNHKLGYKTIIALNGEEGLRLAQIYRPKGILLDLGLPDMDGNQVLHRLKTSPELRKIPVCVISARDKHGDVAKQGIVGYLQKPINFEQLADAEAEVIQRAVEYGKIVLVLEGGSLTAGEISALLGAKAKVIQAGTLEAAIAVAERGGVAVAILDMEQPGDTLDICRQLHHTDPSMPILLHGSRALSEEQAAALSQFTDSIILKKPRAQERMLENIERFLQYQVPSSASSHEVRLPEPSRQNAEKLTGKTILVVDDDPRNLFVITAALEQAGAHVDNVLNGLKAMEYLSKNKPDLIFMDIMMPDMDGYAAIRKIRETPYLQHIPIVALTAKALRSDKEKALEVGADDFLAKPVDYDVLINTAVVWCGDKT